jgi:hypothetical protein
MKATILAYTLLAAVAVAGLAAMAFQIFISAPAEALASSGGSTPVDSSSGQARVLVEASPGVGAATSAASGGAATAPPAAGAITVPGGGTITPVPGAKPVPVNAPDPTQSPSRGTDLRLIEGAPGVSTATSAASGTATAPPAAGAITVPGGGTITPVPGAKPVPVNAPDPTQSPSRGTDLRLIEGPPGVSTAIDR